MKGAVEYIPKGALTTVTASELIRQNIPEPPAVVPGLFVEGVTILAGKPKLGKSWLMLNIALAVACGGRALGKIPVEQGKALYLGLEDNARRLQDRLARMPDEAPPTLHLGIVGDLRRLDDGGLEQLTEWLDRHPDCRLVCIDTLARVRPARAFGGDIYEEDARLGSMLQEIANVHNIALIVVHHLRKAAAEDPLDMVSGSTGLTGSADTVLVLTRHRGEADAVLHVTGRDLLEQELALQFVASEGTWQLLGDAAAWAVSGERRRILDMLERSDKPMTPKEIAAATGLNHGSVRHLLRKLRAQDLVKNPDFGKYEAAVNGEGGTVNG